MANLFLLQPSWVQSPPKIDPYGKAAGRVHCDGHARDDQPSPFLGFVDLLLEPGDILVMVKLAVHMVKGVNKVIEAAGAQLW